MPLGTCDPGTRGDAYNTQEMSIANGDVTLTVRYGWDGVSTRETGCDGPLVDGTGAGNRWAIRAVNLSQTTYYAHTVGKRGQPRVYTLAAGATQTVKAAAAASVGYATISDIYDLTLSTSPTPPTSLRRKA